MNERLDDEIRRLLGDVVATTPEPPNLEERPMSTTERNDAHPSNKWIIGGGVGLLAAAAVVGFFVFTGDSTETVRQDPAVTGPPETVSPSSRPSQPTTTVVISDPVVVPPDPSAPSASTAVTATTPVQPTTTVAPPPPPPPAELSAALTTAGPFGVTVGVPEGSESSIVTEPMAFATTAQDGRIFMQRSTTTNDPDADTTVLVWAPATGELTPLEPPLAADSVPGSTFELHDVATVAGNVTLLYEISPGNCPNPTACVGALMTWQPDTGESTEIASRIVWEGGWSGLELADNGFIVGTESETISNGIFLASIGPAAPPTPADLGLEDSYGDCSVCPFAYTIDPSGRFIGWVDSGVGVTQESADPVAGPTTQIAVADISQEGGFAQRRVAADLAAAYGELDIADIAFGDEGFTTGQAAFLKGGTAGDGNPFPPVKVDLTSGLIGQIDAVSATLNELDR